MGSVDRLVNNINWVCPSSLIESFLEKIYCICSECNKTQSLISKLTKVFSKSKCKVVGAEKQNIKLKWPNNYP